MLNRRQVVSQMAGLCLFAGAADARLAVTASDIPGNPLPPGFGVADPQIRVYDHDVYMYSTHDAVPGARDFVMHDWRVWHSRDLVSWKLVSVLRPEQTYFGKPSNECWATDGARRNGKYYFYFSMGPENIGVVEGTSPAGPWHDPLGRPLIAKGDVPTQSRDPGILQEEDGTSYVVFGTFNYHIARLNEDMISLAERPRPITIIDKVGPFGPGKTDDKPFLHRRGDLYYLSWGSYYAIGRSPYGPFQCKGALLSPTQADAGFRRGLPGLGRVRNADLFNLDRHGSFFQLHGQWYFACNDMSSPGTDMHFRSSVISRVKFRANGEIAPIRLISEGVGRYSARSPINASDYFDALHAQVVEFASDDLFAALALENGAYFLFPNVHEIAKGAVLTLSGENLSGATATIEVRRAPTGRKLDELRLEPGKFTVQATSASLRPSEDLCIIVRGEPGRGGLLRLDTLTFD